MEKLFVNYSKSKEEFINSGLGEIYVNKIVFIGNGECIYTKGKFFANEQELITLISDLIEQERQTRTESVNTKVDKIEGKQLSQEDFTTFFKNKLESLNNYDDTELSNKINTLRSDLDTLVGGDTSEAIETFNEIIAFLEEIEDKENLLSLLVTVESKIPTQLSQLQEDTEHRLVTDSEKADWNNKLSLSGGIINGSLMQVGSVGSIHVKNPSENAHSLIKFSNGSKSLGFLGFTSNGEPEYWTGDANKGDVLVTPGNISNYALSVKGGTLTRSESKPILTFQNTVDMPYINFVKDNNVVRFGMHNGVLKTNNGNGWKNLVTSEDNIATASKLATPIKLWGNDFDGSNDLSGTIEVTSLHSKNALTIATTIEDYIYLRVNKNDTKSVVFTGPWFGPTNASSELIDLGSSNNYWKKLFAKSMNIIDEAKIGFLNFEISNEINSYSDPEKTKGQAIHLNYRHGGNVSLVNGGGKVGIGTANPVYKLDVNGTVRAESVIAGNDTGYYLVDNNGNSIRTLFITKENGLILGYDTASKGYSIRIDGHSLNFRYGTNHAVGMTLNSSGNVTIGESDLANTGIKLYVDGKMHVKDEIFSAYQYGITDSYGNRILRIVNNSPDGAFIQVKQFSSDAGVNNTATLNISGYNGEMMKSTIFNATDVFAQNNLNVKNQITSGDLVDWYGVSWSEDSSDPTCTRIGNMALHRSLPIQNAMKGYLIGKTTEIVLPLDNNWEKSKYDEAYNDTFEISMYVNANVMTKIPEFWYIDDYEPSTKTHNLKISQTAKAGWCHHKEAYVGAYEGYDDNNCYRSKKNVIPTVSVSRETIRPLARANGYEDEYKWNIYTYEEHRAICHLFLVEYATRNSQAPVNTALTADGFKQGGLGSGCTTGTMDGAYSFIPTGTTDSLGNGSGQVAYTASNGVTYYANRYRGIENPFGHIWKHVDDVINIYNSSSTYKTVYKCEKPEYFATNKNAKYKPLCSFPGGSKMQGWSKEIKATINCDFFKYSVGGSESTYWCDYNYDSDDTSEHCLLIGGRSGLGGWAGLFCFDLSNGGGHSGVTIGSRLTYLPWA